jgi:hypothetical protein
MFVVGAEGGVSHFLVFLAGPDTAKSSWGWGENRKKSKK